MSWPKGDALSASAVKACDVHVHVHVHVHSYAHMQHVCHAHAVRALESSALPRRSGKMLMRAATHVRAATHPCGKVYRARGAKGKERLPEG